MRFLYRSPLPWALGLAVLFFSLSAKASDSGLPPLTAEGQSAPTYSLRDCLQIALQRNPSILKAQQDIERAQGVVITAKSTLFPQVAVNSRLEERNDDLFAQGNDKNIQRFRDYWAVQLTATQSLYSGGVNRQQIAIAKLQHEAALVQLQAVINEVLSKVKYAVYAIVVNRAEMEAEEKTIKLLSEEESRQQSLFDAGHTTRFNVLRTTVSMGNQKSLLYDTQNRLVSSEIALTALLNIDWPRNRAPSAPPFLVQESLDCPPVGKIKVDDLIALALTRRSELQVLNRQVEIGQRQIKIDQAANIPRIDAYAAAEERRDQTGSSFDKGINDYGVGLLGTWNVFDGFASRGQKFTDTASLNSTRISREETRLKISNEVREAYARLLNAQATIDSQTANVKTAEQSVGLAQLSSENGYATLLDVLQATLDLTASRTQAIRTRQSYLDALADLERAVSLKLIDWPGANLVSSREEAEPPALVPAPATTVAPLEPPPMPPPSSASPAPSPAPGSPPP